MSQPGKQRITIHILLNISWIKGNQKEIWSVNRISQEKNSSLKLCRKWGRDTSSRPLFVFLKRLGKSKWSAAWCHYISIALKLTHSRNKLFKNLHYWSRDMLNFGFLDKGLGIISTAHFVYEFSTKMILMLYSINWSNFIVWLPLLLEILGNMFIAIVC